MCQIEKQNINYKWRKIKRRKKDWYCLDT